jgi:hypothetical protein
VADRVTETLDAALVDPGTAQLLRTGRLTSALRHVGFGVVDESGESAQCLNSPGDESEPPSLETLVAVQPLVLLARHPHQVGVDAVQEGTSLDR